LWCSLLPRTIFDYDRPNPEYVRSKFLRFIYENGFGLFSPNRIVPILSSIVTQP